MRSSKVILEKSSYYLTITMFLFISLARMLSPISSTDATRRTASATKVPNICDAQQTALFSQRREASSAVESHAVFDAAKWRPLALLSIR